MGIVWFEEGRCGGKEEAVLQRSYEKESEWKWKREVREVVVGYVELKVEVEVKVGGDGLYKRAELNVPAIAVPLSIEASKHQKSTSKEGSTVTLTLTLTFEMPVKGPDAPGSPFSTTTLLTFSILPTKSSVYTITSQTPTSRDYNIVFSHTFRS